MINYGVVYPQSILIFTIIMLYSVVQPLIVIFGAIYFGVAYIVYKYKLLFGSSFLTCLTIAVLQYTNCSILQTIRISRSSLAHHIRPPHLGRRYFPNIYDRYLPSQTVVHPCYPRGAFASGNHYLVLVHSQDAQTA
jgi:hypothetical protein